MYLGKSFRSARGKQVAWVAGGFYGGVWRNRINYPRSNLRSGCVFCCIGAGNAKSIGSIQQHWICGVANRHIRCGESVTAIGIGHHRFQFHWGIVIAKNRTDSN